MEEKQFYLCSTPELWVENGRNKRAWLGKTNYHGSTWRKETNVGKVTPNDQNLQKTEKKIHRQEWEQEDLEIPTGSSCWQLWAILIFKGF